MSKPPVLLSLLTVPPVHEVQFLGMILPQSSLIFFLSAPYFPGHHEKDMKYMGKLERVL